MKRTTAPKNLHAKADAAEARLNRAFLAGVSRASERMSIHDITVKLQLGDQRGAIAEAVKLVDSAMSPPTSIIADTMLRGRKIGAEMVRAATSEE